MATLSSDSPFPSQNSFSLSFCHSTTSVLCLLLQLSYLSPSPTSTIPLLASASLFSSSTTTIPSVIPTLLSLQRQPCWHRSQRRHFNSSRRFGSLTPVSTPKILF
ncbi:hypothetical protein S245_024882 [Arachis hypogaea]